MMSLTGEKRKQLRRRRLDYDIAVEGLPPLAGRSLNDAISSQGQQRDAASPGNGADRRWGRNHEHDHYYYCSFA